jgi:hypothetical protein
MNDNDLIAQLLTRVEELERERDTARIPNDLSAQVEVLRMQLGLTLDRAKEAEARIIQLETVLKWARTCVPFPSDCHDAIQAALNKEKTS